MVKNEKLMFIASVLLDEIDFNQEQYLKDFVQEWGFDIREVDTIDEEIDNDENIIICQIPGGFITLTLMPGPIPDNEVEKNSVNSSWDKAQQVAKDHKAHILITALSNEIPAAELSTLFTQLVTTCLKQTHSTGVYTLGSIYAPDFYSTVTKHCLDNNILALPILVYFGIYLENENTYNGYTYGLEQFGKQEIEIVKSKKDPEEIYGLLMDISNYVIAYDIDLQDGETIGFSEEHKLPISISQALSIETKTNKSIKIEF